jgi:hypothetical protein
MAKCIVCFRSPQRGQSESNYPELCPDCERSWVYGKVGSEFIWAASRARMFERKRQRKNRNA